MFYKNLISHFKRFHRRLNGSTIEYNITPYHQAINEINTFQQTFKNQHDAELKKYFQTLRKEALQKSNLDDLLTETFALVKEVICRVLELQPFDEQLIGGIVIHQGKLAEMQTGEGKTLTAVFPAVLNALTGKGVHILTFNDYLARRDAQWMGPIYQFLGLTVGFVQEGMSIQAHQQAYQADITYLTAKEAGFDYLRDNLCYQPEDQVQRDFNFAIVDEADSILIDEARIPLVIAGAVDDYIADSYYLAQLIRRLEPRHDLEIDTYGRNVYFTDQGLTRIEQILQCGSLYDEANIDLLTRLNCAAHAEYLFHRDVDYIIRDGKVELVDEFTGRVADKRRWPDGLQAAIEAKEQIAIQSKGHILNSITLQHFLQLYPQISGMTATAAPSENEFKQFYNLDIVVIPPHRPCIRQDHADILFPTKAAKHQALIEEIIRVHKTRRPILLGTRSVEESIHIADLLQTQGIPCDVLNAKRDAFEAEIIARAGKLGAVTISTNMAGRGTDIRLGAGDPSEKQKVAALGGLYVIGTNRHESLRIDNQLRGRAGRQGDPGASRFFISMEDDLFIKYRLKDLLPANRIVNSSETAIEDPVVHFEISRVQRIIEGQNLEIKKTLWQYSALLEKQRTIIFQKRHQMLSGDSILGFYQHHSPDQFKKLKQTIDISELRNTCRYLSLYHLDHCWSDYLAKIAELREGIHLARLGGKEPIFEFHKMAIRIFDENQKTSERAMRQSFDKLKFDNNKIDLDASRMKAPSATWTYIINDNPFEHMLGLQLMGNVGMAIGAGLYGPLVALYPLLRKIGRRRNDKG